MNKLQLIYEQLLADYGVEKPTRRPSAGELLDVVTARSNSENAIDRNVANQALNSILGFDFHQEIVYDQTFRNLQADTAIAKYLDEILKCYKKKGIDIETSIYFNEFPTGSFNAEIIRFEEGYLCLVNRGLLRLIYGLVFSIFYPVSGKFVGNIESGKVTLDINLDLDSAEFKEAIAVIAARCYNYLVKGNTDPVYSYKKQIDPATYFAINSLTVGIKSFVIAHEVGHYCLGHLSKATTKKTITPAGTIDSLNMHHQMEFEADLEAIRTLFFIEGEGSGLPVPYYVGAIAFFYIQLILEVLSSRFRNEEIDLGKSSSHPPTADRIKRIRAYCEQNLAGNLFENIALIESLFYFTLKTVIEYDFEITEYGLKGNFPDDI